ncbi:MAG TPA: glycosyltransferase [Stellaceae bacterium]|jgi:hypothetical protein
MGGDSRIGTVVLSVQYSTRSSYYRDWLDAFEASPLFAATSFNLFRAGQRHAAARAVGTAELVVALHSCSADTMRFILPLAEALKARHGRFLMLVGNEYNLPWSRMAEKRAFLRQVGADFVGTQLPRDAGEWLYADTGAAVLALPHALNERVFRPGPPDLQRHIDIGGRSARYPVFVGDADRNRVYELFARLGPEAGLAVDIDTGARLDRAGWSNFLGDCRATIGTEAGSWYLERDDRTALAIRAFIGERNRRMTIKADGALHAATRRLPYRLKERLKGLLKWSPLGHEAFDLPPDSAAEIETRFFGPERRAPVYSKCISSRNFDAAGTGTCQILVRGRYNDIFTADEHYIPLEPDLADVGHAIERFRNPAERGRVAEAAYALVHDHHTYRHRLAELHRQLGSNTCH